MINEKPIGMFSTESLFDRQSSALLDDKRRRERTPALQEGTHVWLTDSRRVSVEVIDESPVGLGVYIPDVPFNLGPQIEVEYQGERRPAVVAYLKRVSDGRHRLGLEWVSTSEQ